MQLQNKPLYHELLKLPCSINNQLKELMKEILQTKQFKHSFFHASVVCLFIRTCIHVENVAKEYQTVEVEEAEPEYQEEQQQEEDFVVAEQASEQELTNSDTQQGKPRCI